MHEYYDCDGNCLSDVDGDLVCDENEIAGCQILQRVITMRQQLMMMVVVHMQMSIMIVMVTVYQM